MILEPSHLCGLLFHDCGHWVDPLHQNWTLPVPPGKPKPQPLPPPPVCFVAPIPPLVRDGDVQAGGPTLRVLHLTDIHIDDAYQTGAEAECEAPLCCRGSNSSNGFPPGLPVMRS